MKKYLTALVAAASLTAFTTACSQDSSAGHSGMDMGGSQSTETTAKKSSLPDGVNKADVSFTQGMIPHHEQAVEMADHVLASGEDAEVSALATRIKEAQGPEIEQMNGWLDGWGQEPMSSAGHSMGDMDGMMSDSEMESFMASMGMDVDVMFLEMMIVHHEGAIAMAEEQIEAGENTDAIALAEAIATSQQAEIEEMQGILERLTSA